MNPKIAPVLIGVALLACVGGLIYLQSARGSHVSDVSRVDASETYTAQEVAAHNDAASCWSAIDGAVYDLTEWIAQHPGGERAILGLCGVDGSAAFHAQHGDAKQQADILINYKIGSIQ